MGNTCTYIWPWTRGDNKPHPVLFKEINSQMIHDKSMVQVTLLTYRCCHMETSVHFHLLTWVSVCRPLPDKSVLALLIPVVCQHLWHGVSLLWASTLGWNWLAMVRVPKEWVLSDDIQAAVGTTSAVCQSPNRLSAIHQVFEFPETYVIILFFQWLLSWLLYREKGYLLPSWAQKMTCQRFHTMVQSSSGWKWKKCEQPLLFML